MNGTYGSGIGGGGKAINAFVGKAINAVDMGGAGVGGKVGGTQRAITQKMTLSSIFFFFKKKKKKRKKRKRKEEGEEGCVRQALEQKTR